MKTQNKQTDNTAKQGSALVIVLGLIVLMTLAGAIMATMTNQSAFRVKKTLKASCALSIAEAGVADVLDIMNSDYTAGIGVSYKKDFGGGSFVVTTEQKASGNILITSVAEYENETRTTRLELLGDANASWDALTAECAIIAGGDATLETAAPEINGRVHANGNIFHSSGNIKILGDITANGVVQISAQPGFTAVAGHSKENIPTLLPFDPWIEMAKNGGIYLEGTQHLKGDFTPANGVLYVNGDVTLSNRSTLKGTLVASGSITIDNRFTQTPFITGSGWPSLMAGIDISLHNRNKYVGTIFAGNDIITQNNKEIDGQLIALNNIYLSNKAQIPTPSTAPVWNPNGTGEPDVVVGGWLQ